MMDTRHSSDAAVIRCVLRCGLIVAVRSRADTKCTHKVRHSCWTFGGQFKPHLCSLVELVWSHFFCCVCLCVHCRAYTQFTNLHITIHHNTRISLCVSCSTRTPAQRQNVEGQLNTRNICVMVIVTANATRLSRNNAHLTPNTPKIGLHKIHITLARGFRTAVTSFNAVVAGSYLSSAIVHILRNAYMRAMLQNLCCTSCCRADAHVSANA